MWYQTCFLFIFYFIGSGLHERTPTLKRITTTISLLGLVTDDVTKRRLGDLTRKICLITRPIAKARAKTMHGYIAMTDVA
jgi:hypothetical protein